MNIHLDVITKADWARSYTVQTCRAQTFVKRWVEDHTKVNNSRSRQRPEGNCRQYRPSMVVFYRILMFSTAGTNRILVGYIVIENSRSRGQKFISSLLYHPVLHAYQNRRFYPTATLLPSSLSFNDSRFSNHIRTRTIYSTINFCLYVYDILGTADSHSLFHAWRLPRAITAELQSVYETGALTLPTTMTWCKRFADRSTLPRDNSRSGRPLTNDLTETIESMLDDRCFLSCAILCRDFLIAKATCLRILHDRPGWKSQFSLGSPSFGHESEGWKTYFFTWTFRH
jgi:hypothetical protein